MLTPVEHATMSSGIQPISDIQINLLENVDCAQIAAAQSKMLLNRGSHERETMAKR